MIRRSTVLLLAAVAACVTVSQVIDPTPFGATELPAIQLPLRGDVLRLAVTGDTGEDPTRVAAAIRRMHALAPFDAVLLLGDNFYSCGVRSVADRQWAKIRDHYSPLGVPIFPVLGNHDYGNPQGSAYRIAPCGDPDPGAQIRATRIIRNWQFPARSYRIEAGEVELFMVDTTPLAENWTRPVLGADPTDAILSGVAAAVARSRARWKIVAGHHTIFGSGRHGLEDPGGERAMRRLHSVMLDHGVDLYLSGHDHHMELISFEETRPAEPVFLISGAGSKHRRVAPRSRTRLPTLFPTDAKSFLGFAIVEISPDSFSVSFFDAQARPRSERFVFGRPLLPLAESPVTPLTLPKIDR